MNEPAPAPPGAPRPLTARSIAFRAIGAVLSLSLLGWCIWVAFRPENREHLQRMLDAPPHVFITLLALSAASLAFNGATFWLTLRPARALPLRDVEAANAVASFLGYLPFKLSILFRFIIHNRRDGVPLLTIGAWLASNAAIVIATLTPPCAASLMRGRIDWQWFVISLGGWAFCFMTLTALARHFAGDTGLIRIQSLADTTRIRPLGRLARASLFVRAHAGLAMLASRPVVAGAMCLRLTDILLQAGRFLIASSAIGAALGPGKSILAASTFFMLGLLSPAGAVGAREGGTTGLVKLLEIPGVSHESLAVVALAVSATEAVVFAAAAIIGAIYLRLHRLLLARGA